MDFEQPQTPIMTDENVATAADMQHALNTERTRHGRSKRTTRQLQSQLDGFAECDLQLRSNIQSLQHTNTALAQEILRLRWTVNTLNGVIQAVCGHSQCHCQYYGRPLAPAYVDERINQPK
jgi:chromosome segregation ATPase